MSGESDGCTSDGRQKHFGSLRRRDHIGERYGRLVAIRFSRIGPRKKTYWLFRCDCGREHEARIDQVRDGNTASCGCLLVAVAKGLVPSQDGVQRSHVILVGNRYGRLVVVREMEALPQRKGRRWLSRCDCGQEVVSPQRNLTTGKTNSCGCIKREKAADLFSRLGQANLVHGMTETPEWLAWKNMFSRCSDPSQRSYPRYGGRGIKICERWQEFGLFFADMGQRPNEKHSLGRIDNNGDYCPENCEWQTCKQQQRNRSNNRPLTLHGVTRMLAEWAESANLTTPRLHSRLKYGWPLDLALSTPVGVRPSELATRRAPVDPMVRLKANAHQAVCQAVKRGNLVRPAHCTHPGCTKLPVEGHHHHGYDREHWLDVVFLCKEHHVEAEKQTPKSQS